MTRTAPTGQVRGVGTPAGLVLLAGLYLIVVPWLVGYDDQARLVLSNTIVGLALALLAVGHTLAPDRMRGLSWVLPVLGLWVVLSPLAIPSGDQAPTPAIWLHNSIGGGVALVAGLVIATWALRRPR